MPKYLSGRVKRTPQGSLTTDRYKFLGLDQAEPNLGDPADPLLDVPAGSQFQIVSIRENPGERYWVPIAGGVQPGALTVREEGTIIPNSNAISSITDFNFRGDAIFAEGFINPDGSPGTGVTITVSAPGTDHGVIFNNQSEFATSPYFTFDNSIGIGSVGIGTSNPTQNLHVVGNVKLDKTIYGEDNQPGATGNLLTKTATGGVKWVNAGAVQSGAGGTIYQVQFHGTTGLVEGAHNLNYKNDKVGIGTSNPESILDVKGNSQFAGITTFVGDTKFDGNVSIAGTLTYEDVTNVDAIGLITARSGVDVNAGGINIDGGGLNITGFSTFNSQVGFSTHVKFNDSAEAQFGDNADLKIYHTGDHSYIQDTGSGNLILDTNGFAIRLTYNDSETMLRAIRNQQVELYYDNGIKFQTTKHGAVVTGILTATDLSITNEVQSNLIPSVDTNFDIGSSSKAWDNLYVKNIEGVANIDFSEVNVTGILTTKDLNVTGVATFLGNVNVGNGNFIGTIRGDGSTNISGINSVTAIKYYGTGGTGSTLFVPDEDENLIAGTNAGIGITAEGTGSNESACYNVLLGCNAGRCITIGDHNIAMGYNAGKCLTTSANNVLIGREVGIGLSAGSSNNVFMGRLAGCIPYGSSNTILGYQAGQCISKASNSVFIGVNAGRGPAVDASTAGCASNHQVFIGNSAGRCYTSGCYNVVLGSNAAVNASGGSYNFFAIHCSARYHCSGSNNIAIGQYAMFCGGNHAGDGQASGNILLGVHAGCRISSSDNNIYLGNSAGRNTCTGGNNIALGTNSLCSATAASHNISLGSNSLQCNISGGCNVSIGYQSSKCQVSGQGNVTIGNRVGFAATEGNYNILMGCCTARFMTCGNRNVMVGFHAGQNLTSGNDNVLIGCRVEAPITDGSSQFAIGNQTDYWITGTSNYNIGIGTDNPTARLQVYRETTFAGNPIIQARSNHGSTNELKFEIDGDGEAYFSGDVGIGTNNPDQKLHVYNGAGNVTSFIESIGGDAVLDMSPSGDGNYSGIIFRRERAGGQTGSIGGAIFMPSNTSNNEAFLYIQAQSATAPGQTGALSDNNGVRLKLHGDDGIFSIENGSSESLRIDANRHVTPGSSESQDLGAADKRWNTFYVKNINASGGNIVVDTYETNTLKVNGISTFVGNAEFQGNVSIAGTLTYEDVTNIDSIGIITARSGIHVLNGGVGISTTSPTTKLDIITEDHGGTFIKLISHTSSAATGRDLNIIGPQQGDTSTPFKIQTDNALSFEIDSNDVLNLSSNYKVGIGKTNPSELLDVAGHIKLDSGPVLENASTISDSLRITTSTGYVEVGSQNASYAHFYTDRGRFYFNRQIIVDTGVIASFNEDLIFRTDQTEERIRIKNDDGFVGIGTTDPRDLLHLYSSSPDIRLQDSDGTSQFSRLAQIGSGLRVQLRDGSNDGNLTIQGYGGGSPTDFVKVASNGRVAIGTDSLSQKLSVQDSIQLRSGTDNTILFFQRTEVGANGWIGIPHWNNDALYIYGPTSNSNEIAAGYSQGDWLFYSGGDQSLKIKDGGSVNIGGDYNQTTDKFQVTGNAKINGNLTVTGILSYDDVTNIDAIGIITARAGVNITGGGLNVVGVSTFSSDLIIPEFIYHAGDLNTKFGFPAVDTFSVETAGSEKLRIDSDGAIILKRASLAKIITDATDKAIYIAGGNDTIVGGNINLFGSTHASHANHIRLRNGGTVAVEIDENGQVGIGTVNPVRPLHIEAADCRIRLTDSDVTTDVELQNSSGDAILTTNGESNVRLQTDNTERLRITSIGRVGIGTDNPDHKLHVMGQVKIDRPGYARILYARNDTNLWSVGLRDTDDFWFFRESGSANAIFPHGKIGIGDTNPQDMLSIRSGANETSLRLVDPTASTYGAHFSFYDSENQVRIGGISNTDKRAAIIIHRDTASNALVIDSSGDTTLGGNLLRAGTGQDIGTNSNRWDKVYANEFIGEINTVQENIITGNLLVTGISTFVGVATFSKIGIGTIPTNFIGDQLVVGDGNGSRGMTIFSDGTTGRILFADGHIGDDRKRGEIKYDHSNNSMQFLCNTEEKVRFRNDGRVGIGTNDPQETLHINSDGNPRILLEDTDASNQVGVRFKTATQNWIAGLHGGVSRFKISNASTFGSNDYFVMDTSGRIGVGIDPPAEKFHVNGGKVWINNGSGDGAARSNGLTVATLPGSNWSPGTDPTDALRTASFIVKGSTRPCIITLRNVDDSNAFWDFIADGNSDKFYIQGNAARVNGIGPVITWDTSNNVGIGTINPLGRLHSSSATHPLIIDDHHISADQGIVFTSYGNSSYKAAIRMTAGGTSKGLRFMTGGYTNTEERVRITETGKVGIGEQDPDWALHITEGSDSARIKIERTGTSGVAGLIFKNTLTEHHIQTNGSNFDIYDKTNTSTRFRIKNNGSINIGGDYDQTTAKLQVTGNTQINGNLTVTGVLTYDDVTNIDAVGVITARAGIDITGGGLNVVGVATFADDVIINADELFIADSIKHINDTNTSISFPSNDTISFNTSGNEKFRINSSGLVEVKNFNGTGLRLTGSGGDYQGIQLKTGDSSASQTRSVFIDVNNETGAAVANQVGEVQSDGGSHWRWDTQPAGNNRNDRREERLRITADGKVGIGITNPASGLDIKHNDGIFIKTATNAPYPNGARIQFTDQSSEDQVGFIRYKHPDGRVAPSTNDGFEIGGSETLTAIHLMGRALVQERLGIGNTNPAYTVDLGESSSTIRLVSENNGTAIRIGAGGDSNDITLIRVDGATSAHDGETNNSSQGFSLKYMGSRSNNNNSFSLFADNQSGTQFEAITVLQDGKVGIKDSTPSYELEVNGTVAATNFDSLSDRRYKTNIQVIDNPIDKVMKIDGVSFDWKETNQPSLGVIADNIQEVLPEIVSGQDIKSVNYNGLIGLLIEVVKDQQKQIDELRGLIDK